ncbi:MAG TPA: flagellar hook protein [Desulfobacterales bacterium]|nr:flagellar hook protein [Desulfobacterales bacterium]
MAGSISTLGVGSGLQLQSILDQLRAVDQKVIDRKSDKITGLNTQLNEFTVVNNKLITLKSSALTLSLSGTYLSRTVTSSDDSAISATVLEGAAVKASTVAVSNLAKQSLWTSSSGFASKDTSIASADATLTVQLGNNVPATEMSLAVASGTTLSQLVDNINDASDNPGITASIVNDGLDPANPYKLVLQSNGTGEDNRISILQQLPDAPLAEDSSQSAANSLDAQFTVDGVAYQRQKNTIDDVIAGVTFTLKSAATATLTVASDDDGLKDNIKSLVTAYNDVVQEVSTKSAYDSKTKKFGILADTTLRDLPSELEGLMTSGNKADSTGTIKNLFDLGMAFNRDGSITIDDNVLSAAISADPDKIKSFFLGDSTKGITGFADKVNDRLRTMTGNKGAVFGEETAAQSRIDDLKNQITEDNSRLDKKYAELTKQFVALDQFMSQMSNMSSFLTGQFNSLSQGWSGAGSSSSSS